MTGWLEDATSSGRQRPLGKLLKDSDLYSKQISSKDLLESLDHDVILLGLWMLVILDNHAKIQGGARFSFYKFGDQATFSDASAGCTVLFKDG